MTEEVKATIGLLCVFSPAIIIFVWTIWRWVMIMLERKYFTPRCELTMTYSSETWKEQCPFKINFWEKIPPCFNCRHMIFVEKDGRGFFNMELEEKQIK